MSRILTLSAVFCISTVVWFSLARGSVELYHHLASENTDPAMTAGIE